MMPPGDYGAELIEVEFREGVLVQRFRVDGRVVEAFSRELVCPVSEEAIEKLRARVASNLQAAAKNLDDIAAEMRAFEGYFNEDDFDELGRLAGLVYQIAQRAK